METLNDTWKLEDMFATIQDCENALEKAQTMASELFALRDSFTKNAENLMQAFTLKDELEKELTACYVYAKMRFDQNMSAEDSKALYEKCDAIGATIAEKMAFFVPSLLQLSEEDWDSYKNAQKDLTLYDFFMQDLFEEKKHILSNDEEKIMSQLSSLSSSFVKAYDDLTVNDMYYSEIDAPNGKKIKADNSNYAIALTDSHRDFRKNYFENLLQSYKNNENTITSLYYGSVKSDVYDAKLRHYPDSLSQALDNDHIPTEVYTNLLDTVSKGRGVLEDYLNYRKEKLNLDEVHFYDLFVPLSEETNQTYTFEEAQNLVLDATEILGQDYRAVLEEAFNNRWIDRYPRDYKDSGAYAIHSYGYHPFSLMNFTGTLNDVFTIAHELGHVMHSYYSMKHQPFVYSDYCIFTAEVASTVNEQLLFNHLYKNCNDTNLKRFLLSNQLDNIRSTFFRQTLFADFEWQAHQLVEKNQPLTPNVLKAVYKEVYHKYHGDALVVDELLLSEWSRIPHFYRAYYVYQYATGISAAVAISNRILKEDQSAVKDYRTFLTKGGSDHPIELLKIAGVDMTSPAPIEATLKEFEHLLSELKALQ